ncbi:hypothetical protein SARC_14240 [Sphaeroforma arctica JP610]|uniref:Uncharacterized protein n=1 Tax=Sphaeroforma arctica JP610 TaxID=667725 RepID=A0A0L0F905_9EUKA|nr:hypothetical protein SARC_14240 [Sphaeroforma arctica JP610]KNC73202.1 hypothetical protein SARC_14240 [Sphaeroforma arctica JP610]|eukprot:XP_014147104.1 hypothetical protein SARC_14240 [Sphaeroforma arctica JP610]
MPTAFNMLNRAYAAQDMTHAVSEKSWRHQVTTAFNMLNRAYAAQDMTHAVSEKSWRHQVTTAFNMLNRAYAAQDMTHEVSEKSWRHQVITAFNMLNRAYAAQDSDVLYELTTEIKHRAHAAWDGVSQITHCDVSREALGNSGQKLSKSGCPHIV